MTYTDGTTANKPMTQFGSADVKDNQVAKIPIEQFMSQVRGYSQMVGQLNQPERAKFIGSMVNPPDKSAMRQESEGYRKELLDISKDEGKQLAALNKDGAMMDEKQLATAKQEIKSNLSNAASRPTSFTVWEGKVRNNRQPSNRLSFMRLPRNIKNE